VGYNICYELKPYGFVPLVICNPIVITIQYDLLYGGYFIPSGIIPLGISYMVHFNPIVKSSNLT
jgi:hypothetical protein